MIYRSNLTAPDLAPNFKHTNCRVMPHSNGHHVLSDFSDVMPTDPVLGLYQNCGFMTHDEAAILYNCANALKGRWLDIGCHTGWTTLHIQAAGALTGAIDPMLRDERFRRRFMENVQPKFWPHAFAMTSDEFFEKCPDHQMSALDGAMIDGDHMSPHPLRDAQNVAANAKRTACILFHDFVGWPVQEAVLWLIENGWQFRPYWTPHMMACCYRGDFAPPEHTPDPAINWDNIAAIMPFWGKVEKAETLWRLKA